MPQASPSYESKLVSRYEVAQETTAFLFEKPPQWKFQAGQFLDLTLLDPALSGANKYTFSIASAPQENTLMVTTRIRNTAFKGILNSLALGTAVNIEGPGGDLTLDQGDTRTAVLLAGGIGITPFRSIVYDAASNKAARHIFLFYSNRRPEDALFLEELQTLEAENPKYKFIPTMTQMAKSRMAWHGEVGRIDKEMLGIYLQDIVAPVYYVAGPPGMVKGLSAMARQAGVKDDHIHAEEFDGY